ncbi:hypothetical protein ACFRAE_08660 [Sphingobacterium sp. HJSM2_6]|uniref:hypothetical protein n=1 Tax=Sphingobacterium sp. HJSM2_6 TaxID=3366264 RepID=UPI003BBE5406
MDWRELENLQTAELIEFIQGKEHFYEAAECAFKAFYFRFEKDLIHKCRVVSVRWGYDNSIGDILCEQALQKFWNKAHLFNPQQCRSENLDKCVLFYIYRIAERLLADRGRVECKGIDYSGEEELIISFPDLENLSLPKEKLKDLKAKTEVIDKALDRLGIKHKIIYLTYQSYEKNGKKLPRQLLKKLREQLELSQNSIRVYKKEALETVSTVLKVYGTKK